jgi:hypothetical protein
MFRKTVFAALAAATALASAPAFAASAVVGTWDTTINVQETKINAEVTVAEANGGYTVDIKDGPMPGAPGGPEGAAALPSKISEVAVDGDTLKFKRHLTTPQGEMDLAYALTAAGNNLTGTINSQFGDIPVTGVRK